MYLKDDWQLEGEARAKFLLIALTEIQMGGASLRDSRLPDGFLRDLGKAADGDQASLIRCDHAFHAFRPRGEENDPFIQCWAAHGVLIRRLIP